ncbi:MAG TPA: thiol peroxidase [Bryobacteraceae bacterium]|nr:thiol peroxidase [Bryobacteraceae bacterium]
MDRTAILRGNPVTLAGSELHPGDAAPDFTCVDTALKPVTLAGTGHGVRIFSVLPSLDTPVCDAQTRRFNEEAAKLSGVDIYTISVDLPFAQRRYCNSYAIDRVKMLSDHKDVSFGRNYGTLLEDLRLECRAIFVLDRDNVIRYVEYVKETGEHPDYEPALRTARALAGEAQSA